MAAASIAESNADVIVGVDTHKHSHFAKAKDQLGRDLDQLEIPTGTSGYADLLSWAQGLGRVIVFGVEGTSSYGAGLARFLIERNETVIEVLRPTKRDRRLNGKSDSVDADAAASAVLSGKARAIPKAGDQSVEMIRAIRIAKVTAIKARTQAVNAIKAMVVIAPEPIREVLRHLTIARLMATCSRYRVDQVSDPITATKLALRSMSHRYLALHLEIRTLEKQLSNLTQLVAPQLTELPGVGQDVASALLLTAGNGGSRLRSEAAFSMLCGSSPIQASSGLVQRHRLNRGGDRQANAALHRVVMVRLKYHQPTKEYMARRRAEGKSKADVIRCLKRYIAREIYRVITTPRVEQVEANAA